MRIEYILIALAFVSIVVEAVVLCRLSKENKRLEQENKMLNRVIELKNDELCELYLKQAESKKRNEK